LSQESKDRRVGLRYMLNPVRLVQILPPGASAGGKGAVVDMSRTGLRIRCETLLQKGAILRVEFPNMIVTGEVRYCRPVEGASFHAGLRILSLKTIETPSQPAIEGDNS